MKQLLNKLLQTLKKDTNYKFDDRLLTRDCLAVFWKMGWSLCRGIALKWRLKASAGLLFVHPGAIIRNPKYIRLGKNVVFESGCEVQGISELGIQIGDGVTVGRLAMVRPSGYYGREIGEGLKVGAGSNIGPYCYIGCAGYIEIGENVLMGPRVGLFAENHIFLKTDIPIKQQGVSRKGIVIEDDCWLGTNSVILDGVRVGKGSVIAAGSVVTKDAAPFSVMAGNPAKLIKSRLGSSHD